jgi:hypothetical protein
MTAAVREILKSFDDLPAPERHVAAVEILRRAEDNGDLPDTALIEAADELFQSSDADAQRSAR